MAANKNPSCYEEALAYIEELKRNIENLYVIIECDDKLTAEMRLLIEKQNAIIKTDDQLIAKYEELIMLYQKERGE